MSCLHPCFPEGGPPPGGIPRATTDDQPGSGSTLIQFFGGPKDQAKHNTLTRRTTQQSKDVIDQPVIFEHRPPWTGNASEMVRFDTAKIPICQLLDFLYLVCSPTAPRRAS
jgi:hypothetical protein